MARRACPRRGSDICGQGACPCRGATPAARVPVPAGTGTRQATVSVLSRLQPTF
ncbi:hypothetical protein L519_0443 [Bordetella bronchiseptica MBORD678]|nr:hypothetical protein L519_0443 [Bordetella bronchiseptica MBORD678]